MARALHDAALLGDVKGIRAAVAAGEHLDLVLVSPRAWRTCPLPVQLPAARLLCASQLLGIANAARSRARPPLRTGRPRYTRPCCTTTWTPAWP